jgi:hypothetical protein
MDARLNILVALALMLAIVTALVALIQNAHGGEKQLCHVEPGTQGEWHYRTNIDGKSRRCYYEGERMKPRSELYWAEIPSTPSSVDHLPWQLELRWQGEVE